MVKKLDRKQEEQRKKAEALKKKAEAKALFEKEEESIKTANLPLAKLRKAQLIEEVKRRNQNAEITSHSPKPSVPKVESNHNMQNRNLLSWDREVIESIEKVLASRKVDDTGEKLVTAEIMKDAYAAFEERTFPIMCKSYPRLEPTELRRRIQQNWRESLANPINKVKDCTLSSHVMKEMDYAEYEERELPILEAKNRKLNLSQLKQLASENWQKALENPANQIVEVRLRRKRGIKLRWLSCRDF